ncbi:MAG: Lrp/AsnC family transcriptional regulator [Ancrocorticia sp.]
MRNTYGLDATDYAILRELEADGKLTNVELADRVGLTPAPCLRRVKRLQDDGVIAGYRARLNPDVVGRAFCVYMAVEITMTSREVVEAFEKEVVTFEEVTEVRRTYGATDYLIRVEVEDSNAYERFQSEKMYALPAIHRITSHPTMRLIKSNS